MSSIPARMKKIQLKIKTLERSQDFSHYKSMGIFPDTQGQVTLQSMVGSGQISLFQDFIVVLVTCKNEEDPIKNEGARVFTTLYSNISDAQGQITLELMVVSGRNLNSFKLTCMSPLPARMRIIESKMKELECSQDFSHYKSMGIFPDTQGQVTLQSMVGSGQISLFQDFIVVLVTCKNEEDPIKNEGARVFTTLYSNLPDAQGQITLELVVVSG